MDYILENEIQTNTQFPSLLPNLNMIKLEVCDDNLTSKNVEVDDYGFEPYHENVFRKLSSNFDNVSNIKEVDEAFKKLENCFIDNKILNQNGASKFTVKGDSSSYIFLKYRDIDDAFADMVISETNGKLNASKNNQKKIDLKTFEDSIFSVNIDDESQLSDSDEGSNFKTSSDSDSESLCYRYINDFINENDDTSDTVVDAFKNGHVPDKSSSEVGHHSNVMSEALTYDNEISTNTNEFDDINEVIENVICHMPLKRTVREVRVVVEKLGDNVETIVSNTSDAETGISQQISKETRQVARKKTGGMVTTNVVYQKTNIDDKMDLQVPSKDNENVPNVFDKMTRAGKRDLERVLAESTANLVIQKTTELISEKIKVLQSEKEDDEGSSSDDEAKESDIHKTAEIVTNTILEFLTKNKTKKLEKLGKEISEEITNKMNILNCMNEINNITEDFPTSQTSSPKKVNTSKVNKTDKSSDNHSTKSCRKHSDSLEMKNPEKADVRILRSAEKVLEDKAMKCTEKSLEVRALRSSEKNLEDKVERTPEKTLEVRLLRSFERSKESKAVTAENLNTSEENVNKKVIRDTRSQRRKTATGNPTNIRKTLAEEFEEITRVKHECEIIVLSEEEEKEEEPKRPATRQSKQKHKETPKASTEHLSNPPEKSISLPKRKISTNSRSKKSRSRKSRDTQATSISDSMDQETSVDDQMIDGQFLIDAEFSKESTLIVNDSKKSETIPIIQPTILKATADSTTSDNGETCSSNITICNSPLLKASTNDENSENGEVNNSSNEVDIVQRPKETNLESESKIGEGKINNNTQNVCGNTFETESKKVNHKEKQNTNELNSVLNLEKMHSEMISQIVKDGNNESKKETLNFEEVSINTWDDCLEANTVKQSNDNLVKKTSDNKNLNNDEEKKEQNIEAPFQVLNDMITDIEEKLRKAECEQAVIEKPKPDLEENYICRRKKDTEKMEFSMNNISFLNYTLEDSFRLTIDEGTPKKEEMDKNLLKPALDNPLEGKKLINHTNKENHIIFGTNEFSSKNNVCKDVKVADQRANSREKDAEKQITVEKEHKLEEHPVKASSKDSLITSRKTCNSLEKLESSLSDAKNISNNEQKREEPKIKPINASGVIITTALNITGEIKKDTLTQNETVVTPAIKGETPSDANSHDILKTKEDDMEDVINLNKKEKKTDIDRKQLTNEQKIAQLTRRDPRLIHEKKIAHVLMRDPRMRNKIPKSEDKVTELNPAEPSPIDLIPLETEDQHAEKNIKIKKQIEKVTVEHKDSDHNPSEQKVTEHKPINQEEHILQETSDEQKLHAVKNSKTDSKPIAPIKPVCLYEVESKDSNVDVNRKKKSRKAFDEELLYKTPLSDLHETPSDRPSYERTTKKRRVNLTENKDIETDEFRVSTLRRVRLCDEPIAEREIYGHPVAEEFNRDDYYHRQHYEERIFRPYDEGVQRTEFCHYGDSFEERNFNQERYQNVLPGPSHNYDQDNFNEHRMHNDSDFFVNNGRNEFQDNHMYSRREFFRRNKFTHDHDHFSNNSPPRTLDSHQENYFQQNNNFDLSTDSVLPVSAQTPAFTLPYPNYNQEEEFDQTYDRLDTDNFSPPSSDLCPPPPLIPPLIPELRRESHCPSPPRIRNGPDNRDYEDFNRAFNRNYDRDDRHFNDRNNSYRDNWGNNWYRGTGRDHHSWNDESTSKGRFVMEINTQSGNVGGGVDEDRSGGSGRRWRRSPSWSPDRSRRWPRERSISPPQKREPRLWDSPPSPSPPHRWNDKYRERGSFRNHYNNRYN